MVRLVAVFGDVVIGTECGAGATALGGQSTAQLAGFLPGPSPQASVYINDILVHLDGHMNSVHTIGPPLCAATHFATLKATSKTVWIDNLNVGRDLDLYPGCTGVVKAGLQTTVFAGD